MPGKQIQITYQSWMAPLVRLLVAAAVLAAVIGVIAVVNRPKPLVFGHKTLVNSGYAYSFKFLEPANLETIQGHHFYAFKTRSLGMIINAQPYSGKAYTKCAEVGAGWADAFNVNIQGASHLVCVKNKADFVVMFNASGQQHFLSVVCQPAQAESFYPRLKTIFSSVQVAPSTGQPAPSST